MKKLFYIYERSMSVCSSDVLNTNLCCIFEIKNIYAKTKILTLIRIPLDTKSITFSFLICSTTRTKLINLKKNYKI